MNEPRQLERILSDERGTGWNEPDSERQQLLDLANENKRLRAAVQALLDYEDTHAPGEFILGDVVIPGKTNLVQICADEDCQLYWPCPVEELRREFEAITRLTQAEAHVSERSMGLYWRPFWKLTQWGFIRGSHWGYEEHDNYGETEPRRHWFVMVPLVGQIVFWRVR